MIFGMLGGRSPQGKPRYIDVGQQQKTVSHLTLRQVKRLRYKRDDVFYQGKIVEKAIVLGRVLSFRTVVNETGKSMFQVSLADCTDKLQLRCYANEHTASVLSVGEYLKVVADVRCGGLIYRPQVKLTGTAVIRVRDFNQITCHLLECML